MLQCGQRLAEDLQQAALHSQQRLLLNLLPLTASATTFRFLGCRLRGPLGSGQWRWGQRLAILCLFKRRAGVNS